jgi:hypothetical protein
LSFPTQGGIKIANPTHHDAMLMLQLAQWGATLGIQEAANWLWSDDFVPEYNQFVTRPAGHAQAVEDPLAAFLATSSAGPTEPLLALAREHGHL